MSPLPHRVFLRFLVIAILAHLAGCASLSDSWDGDETTETSPAPVVGPTAATTPEEQVLAALESAGTGEQIVVAGGVRASGDQPYTAASGRTCRWVKMSYPGNRSKRQLACRLEGRWQWVPSVLADTW